VNLDEGKTRTKGKEQKQAMRKEVPGPVEVRKIQIGGDTRAVTWK